MKSLHLNFGAGSSLVYVTIYRADNYNTYSIRYGSPSYWRVIRLIPQFVGR